jgi:hypothetical protein
MGRVPVHGSFMNQAGRHSPHRSRAAWGLQGPGTCCDALGRMMRRRAVSPLAKMGGEVEDAARQ